MDKITENIKKALKEDKRRSRMKIEELYIKFKVEDKSKQVKL